MVRAEIRIVGSGGQGAITIGSLLGRVATLYERKVAAQTHSYGAAVRGGIIWTEVVISDEEIDYPGVIETDAIIVMSQEAADRYASDIREGSTVIIDSSLVQKPSTGGVEPYQIPASELAERKLGNGLFANMILLGFLVGLTGVVNKSSLTKAVKEGMRLSDLNIRALEIGFTLSESKESSEGRINGQEPASSEEEKVRHRHR
ncbi:MAG: 2-oxoacid:acceptor oxidoreductase family protein [Promethearchaeota archaeon]